MKKTILAIALAGVLAAGCAGAGQQTAERRAEKGALGVEPYPFEAHFMTDPAPEQLAVVGNPLDYAGAKIGQNVRDFPLPRATETYYRFAGRFPIIDAVSNNPLYMKQWAEDTTATIRDAHRGKGVSAIEKGLELLCGTAVFGRPLKKRVEIPAIQHKESPFTAEYDAVLGRLCGGCGFARDLAAKAKRKLTEEDIAFFNANPGYYLAPDGKRMVSLTGNCDSLFAFTEHARRVAFEDIFTAACDLNAAVKDYIDATRDFKPAGFPLMKTAANELIYSA